MVYGICNQTFIPVRIEPKEQSEMVTQLLFGELYSVQEKFHDWYRVKNDFDGYEGWINAHLHTPLTSSSFHNIKKSTPLILDQPINFANRLTKEGIFWLLAGSSIYGLQGKTFSIDKEIFKLENLPEPQDSKPIREKLIELALRFHNIPYLWGGRSTFGIDCSGLSQLIYKIAGIAIPRDASQQINMGKNVEFIDDAKPGDLVFFDNTEGKITHVGIFLPDKKIIHASGKVRIDNIDYQGIYNIARKEYSHKLRLIKNIIGD